MRGATGNQNLSRRLARNLGSVLEDASRHGRSTGQGNVTHVREAHLRITEHPGDERLPRYPDVSAVLIGRLARDVTFPGVGSLSLADALTRCVRVSTQIAASVIVVDSKGEAATRFYSKFRFLSLPKIPHRMFLSMATAEKL